MKVVNVKTEIKEYNGNIYTAYTIKLNDRGLPRIVKCTGSLPVDIVNQDFETLHEIKLRETDLKAGDEVNVYFEIGSSKPSLLEIVITEDVETFDLPM